MKMQAKLASIVALTVALGVGVYAFKAHSQDGRPGFGPFGMHRMGPGMMGMALDEATRAQLQVIHTMLVNHDRIGDAWESSRGQVSIIDALIAQLSAS